jgi:hypothetical protein
LEKNLDKKIIKDLTGRTIAYIILKISGTFVGASVIGLVFWQSAAMAGIAGLMEVTEEMSRNYINDGKISKDELDASFTHLTEDEEA